MLNTLLGALTVTLAMVGDPIAQLAAIPAGYGIGTWLGAVVGELAYRDNAERRGRCREWGGVLGGAGGFAVWLNLISGG